MEIDLAYCQELFELVNKSHYENDVKLALILKGRISGAIRVVFNQTHCRNTLTMLGLLFKLEVGISTLLLSALNEESMALEADPFDVCLIDLACLTQQPGSENRIHTCLVHHQPESAYTE